MNSTARGVQNSANGMAGLLHVSGVNASQGLAGGILAGEGAAAAAAQQVAAATSAALAAGLHVHSPSTLTHQYGLWVAQGLANGIMAGTPMIESAIRALLAMMAFGHAAALSPSLLTAPAVSGYHPGSVPAPVYAGGGGGATTVTVNIPIAGHVLTSQQLMDLVRDGVQEYLRVNADNGFVRQGRPG